MWHLVGRVYHALRVVCVCDVADAMTLAPDLVQLDAGLRAVDAQGIIIPSSHQQVLCAMHIQAVDTHSRGGLQSRLAKSKTSGGGLGCQKVS